MHKWTEMLKALNFSRFVIFHPFKGFWELKREKRGTVLSASAIILAVIIIFVIRRQFTGFVLNNNDPNEMNVLFQICYVLCPFLVWCIANWSVTTLMEGEGTFRDIYIASAYALVPLVLLNVPMVLLSQVLVENEVTIYTLLDSISIIWTAFLLIIGIMTVHQYSMFKTIATTVITLVAMIVILVIILLFFSLMQQMYHFLCLLGYEIFQR